MNKVSGIGDVIQDITKDIDFFIQSGILKAKDEIINDEIKFLQILCMSGGINNVAMKIVFDKIEELKQKIGEIK
jgi:hypothetical protein